MWADFSVQSIKRNMYDHPIKCFIRKCFKWELMMNLILKILIFNKDESTYSPEPILKQRFFYCLTTIPCKMRKGSYIKFMKICNDPVEFLKLLMNNVGIFIELLRMYRNIHIWCLAHPIKIFMEETTLKYWVNTISRSNSVNFHNIKTS